MKKYQYLIISLSVVILIIVAILIYVNFFEEKIIFTLFGDKEITIYEGGIYEEYGFVAFNESGENVNDHVVVKSDLDVNKVGKYKINYTVRTGLRVYRNVRTINVVKDELKEIDFRLNGVSIVNLQVGNLYDDPRFICVNRQTNEDFSKYVIIENNINQKKPGIYQITYTLNYDGKSKVLTRKVYIFAETNSYTLSTTSLTNKPVAIKFQSYIYNFSHVICPNENAVYNSTFTYNIYENGKYTFYVFDTLGSYETYTITINNIDTVAPTGTCTVVLKDGKTSYNVKTSDTDISKYLYNNEEKYAKTTKTFVADTYLRNDMVTLVDKANNKTIVQCEATRTYLPVIKASNTQNTVYTASSDSLVLNVSKQDGYYLTNIWAKDPYLQMRKEMLSNSAKSLQLPKKMLETAISKYSLQNKIVIGGNASAPVLKGSHYSYVAEKASYYNLKEASALLVYNGDVIINDYKTYAANTTIYYINGKNELSYIPIMENKSASDREKVFEEALDSGIYNTFAFNPMLVIDGKVQSVTNDYYALRNGFCQIDENNFIWVVSDTKKWHKRDFATFMGSLGCKTAVNFDGGGSVALFYKAKNSNSLSTLSGNTRALASVLYFTELD